MSNDELDRLIQRYLDGLITDDECVRFERVMRDQPLAREAFWNLAEVHLLASEAILISQSAGSDDTDKDMNTREQARESRTPLLSESDFAVSGISKGFIGTWASIVAVSCAVVLGLFAWRAAIDSSATIADQANSRSTTQMLAPHPPAPSPRGRVEGKKESLNDGATEGFARVVDSRSALSFNEDRTLQAGQVLGAERILLSAGVLEIALSNGINLIVEGPCDFEMVSSNRVVLHRGQVVVDVPEGLKTFRFDTNNVQIVEASNEFAIDAESENSTVIQVYDGIVQVDGDLNSTKEMSTQVMAGKAVRYTMFRSAQTEDVEFAPDRFIRKLSKDKAIEVIDESSVSQFNQPAHEAISVWRRRSPIEIDGELDDWPIAEGFRSVWDKSREGREYVAGQMMYDEENLYVSAHVGDPFSMLNVIDPESDSDVAWRGGGLQIRLWAERNIEWPADLNSPEYYLMRSLPVEPSHREKAKNQRIVHLNLWYHAPTRRSCLQVAYGMEFKHLNDRINPPNFKGIFRRDEDGHGYVAEYAIPWELLNASGDPPRSGDRIPLTWTTHWGDQSGRIWRGQQNELRNVNEPSRISSWERAATWDARSLSKV